MGDYRSFLAAAARRFPIAATLAKPVLHPILRRLPLSAPPPDAQAAIDAPMHEAVADAGAAVGSRARGRHVLMLVKSDLRIDPRVEREARALAGAGWRVSVMCPEPGAGQGAYAALNWGAGVTIRPLDWQAAHAASERAVFYPGLLFQAALAFAKADPIFAVHGHDLNVAYAALGVAHATGAHLVVDFHEWTSENVYWNPKTARNEPFPPPLKAELQAMETRVLMAASASLTVCDSIADAIAAELTGGRKPAVVRNIPALTIEPTRPYPALKRQLGLADDRFVLLWQGGTGPTRLIEPIIEALAFAPACTLVVRGPSLDVYGEGYRALARRVGAQDRLILQDSIPSRDVVAAARGADAGVWTLPRLCRNFTYALPNKIFEYAAAGLPVLVADYPEARAMVEGRGFGLIFDPYDPRSIAAAINRLIEEPDLRARLAAATGAMPETLQADREWGKLVDLYARLPAAGA